MALDWLDAARYADTNGFSIDGGRHMWLWRDWVINAFNRNMPYDQFLLEQLAGDLLPNHTDAQLIATGFQRNNMVTHEGGTIPEENLTNYNVDRVKTLGEAVLGLTLGCCQCHDHKYDPITQRDYYRIFAYFNTLSDMGLDGNGGVNPRPMHHGPRRCCRRRISSRSRTDLNGAAQGWPTHPQAVRRLGGRAMRRADQRGGDFVLTRWRCSRSAHPTAAGRASISTPGGSSRCQRFGGLRCLAEAAEDRFADHRAAGGVSSRSGDARRRLGLWSRRHGPANGETKTKGESQRGRKGNFVLTAFSASSDAVPGDQVNLHRLLPCAP